MLNFFENSFVISIEKYSLFISDYLVRLTTFQSKTDIKTFNFKLSSFILKIFHNIKMVQFCFPYMKKDKHRFVSRQVRRSYIDNLNPIESIDDFIFCFDDLSANRFLGHILNIIEEYFAFDSVVHEPDLVQKSLIKIDSFSWFEH